jgi:hypothetical protein
MRFLSGVLVLVLLASSVSAQPWYARGQFNGWSLDNPMTDQGGGHYTAQITGLFDNEPYNWKIANNDWSINMPSSDSRVYTDINGEIMFHLYDNTSWDDGWFPNTTRRVGYNDHQQFDWEVVGTFNGWPGAADPNFALTDMGNGLHRGVFALNSGIQHFKFRGLTATAWDTAIGNDFGNGSSNIQIAVLSNGDPWTFELDLPNGRWRAFSDAAPPGTHGDYNDDGFVDAADYTVWRNNLGTMNVLPNDPHGGTITVQQYNTWKTNYGMGTVLSWIAQSPTGAINNQQLTSLGGGQYELNLTGLTPASDHDIQIARSDLSSLAPGSPMKVRADGDGNINLNFYELTGASWGDGWSPDNKHRVGYEDHDLFDWEIVGSFNGWPGTNDPMFLLTDQDNGLHTGSFSFDTPGTYLFKFRQIAETNP